MRHQATGWFVAVGGSHKAVFIFFFFCFSFPVVKMERINFFTEHLLVFIKNGSIWQVWFILLGLWVFKDIYQKNYSIFL